MPSEAKPRLMYPITLIRHVQTSSRRLSCLWATLDDNIVSHTPIRFHCDEVGLTVELIFLLVQVPELDIEQRASHSREDSDNTVVPNQKRILYSIVSPT